MTKLYFAGAESYWKYFKDYPQAHLLSYYPEIGKRPKDVPNPLFCDSGAFKIMTGKHAKEITIQDYADYLKKHKEEFEVYATLDVLWDWKATAKNQAYLEEQGLNPLPAFHIGSPFKVLKEMVQRYDYIAIGGIARERSKAKLQNHLNKVFTIARDTCKLHCFGRFATFILEYYPFYSADATSWLEANRLGGGFVYYFKDGEMVCNNYKNPKHQIGRHLADHWEQNEDGSINRDLRGNKHYKRRTDHNIRAWLQYESYLQKLWRERGIEWN